MISCWTPSPPLDATPFFIRFAAFLLRFLAPLVVTDTILPDRGCFSNMPLFEDLASTARLTTYGLILGCWLLVLLAEF